jgi:hypothetical protein
MHAIRRDIVERLRETRRCVQFDPAGRLVAFDGYPSDLEREAADEIERLRNEVSALRRSAGHVATAEPTGCPTPGACSCPATQQ